MRYLRYLLTLTAELLLVSTLTIAQQATITHSSNFRQSPSTKSKIIGSLESGDSVTLTSTKKTNGYFPAKTTSGTAGWVWAKNVSTKSNLSAYKLNIAPTLTPHQFEASCDGPAFPGESTVMDGTGCPSSGNGGAETAQNEEKNNFCASGTPQAVTIKDLGQLQRAVQQAGDIPFGNPSNHPLSDTAGPATDRSGLTSIGDNGLGEGTQVTLVGYVKIARQEGAESVNCGKSVPNSADYHDIHISIVSTPQSTECSGIVAEMIPHHRPDSWTADIVNQVSAAKLQVRLTGNLMFDSSHTPCQKGAPIKGDPSRSSLWEVHPIYKFEVCTNGMCADEPGWVDLADWKP